MSAIKAGARPHVIEEHEKPVEETNVLGKHWRTACAVIYLVICVFDFLIMPAMLTKYSENIDYAHVYQEIAKLESPQAQVALINKINYKIQTWDPLTLQGAGMFHVAFGAILTGVALSRTGRERTIKRID
jgi:hypothetical protein